MMKCPACLQDIPDSQKFCGECGARLNAADAAPPLSSPSLSYTPPHLAEKILLSRSALEGERKLVTVMFCDIANSTHLATRLGAEAMRALLNRFFEMALAEIHCYEGTINQFLGDGFMALFGAPIAHEDHARRALLAASSIQQRLREISAVPITPDMRVRMGINTGTVVVGKIGDNLRMDYTAVGDATNLTARIQQYAKPGTIRVSESTYRAARMYFEFKPVGRQAFKGFPDRVQVYELLKVRSADQSADVDASGVGSTLVGRDVELSILLTSVQALGDGRGGIVMLRGEPGVGKSRLIAEARSRSGSEDVLWLEGRALSFGRRLSYWPFIEIMKRCFGIENTDAEAQAWQKLEQGARELFDLQGDEVVPYLATLLALEMIGEYEQRVKFLDAQALRRPRRIRVASHPAIFGIRMSITIRSGFSATALSTPSLPFLEVTAVKPMRLSIFTRISRISA
jgi:class 3 adenylate cyclase